MIVSNEGAQSVAAIVSSRTFMKVSSREPMLCKLTDILALAVLLSKLF